MKSILGYVLGLGDRHGDHILIDTLSGEAMHVNFNCLVEQGKTLNKPCIPFRLTHNMIDAFGVTCVEGGFRATCLVTMTILGEHGDLLTSFIKTLFHDLEECKKQGKSKEGNRVRQLIQDKLQGLSDDGLQLSIDGQVEYLINQATDWKRLAPMGIEWAPRF